MNKVMKQYIDKDIIIAEIERQRNAYIGEPSKYKVLSRILSFIDTLEVKEVDLVKGEDYINDLIGFFHQNNKLRNTKADIINWLKSFKE